MVRFAEEQELELLGEEIAALAAQLHATTYLLLVRLREFDAREGWSGGFRSCAHWLSWRTGLNPGAAREHVRVARALARLPETALEMQQGALSYAKVRALTRVATPENEGRLLELARHGTASQVERVVRAWRRVDRAEEAAADARQHGARALTLYVDEDGMYVLRGRLAPEVGALLERALEAAREAVPAEAGSLDYDPVQRRADALGEVAARSLRAAPRGGQADRYQVVVHVDAETLKDGATAGESAVAGGPHVSAETSRRIACDASLVVHVGERSGRTLSVGRRLRTVPPPIRRALERRDGGCRFPGCGLRYCDAHHIRHWADGGATRLDNLVLLCRRHHRAVHEEGFTVDAALTFRRPDGRVLENSPALPRPAAAAVPEQVPEGVWIRPLDLGHALGTYLALEPPGARAG